MKTLRTLEEHRERLWGTSDGRKVKIRQMTNNHILNLREYLEKIILQWESRHGERSLINTCYKELESYEEWIETVEAEMTYRGLERGRLSKTPSPLTEDETVFLRDRINGIEEVLIKENDLILKGGGHEIDVERYAIATEMWYEQDIVTRNLDFFDNDTF